MLVIVQLLTGEVPERSIFSQKGMRRALEPYLAITHAVRSGDLATFARACNTHGAALRAHRTYNLVTRCARPRGVDAVPAAPTRPLPLRSSPLSYFSGLRSPTPHSRPPPPPITGFGRT